MHSLLNNSREKFPFSLSQKNNITTFLNLARFLLHCIHFGVFFAFTFVNLSVIFYYFIKKKQRSFKGTVLYLIIPLIGATLDIWLLLNLDFYSKLLGGICFALGFVYLLFLTKGLKKTPPKMKLSGEHI